MGHNLVILDNELSTDRHSAAVYLMSLSESSRRVMRGTLNAIALLAAPGLADEDVEPCMAFPWQNIRYQHAQALRAALVDKYEATTANRHLTALRRVLKECWRLGYITAEEYHRAADLERAKGQKARQAERGRALQHEEILALLAACDTGTYAGRRDAALVAVAYSCGLRRAEVVGLDVDDWHRTDSMLHVRKGKGNKDRMMPVHPDAAALLGAWLDARPVATAPIFVRIRRGDIFTDERLTTQAVYTIFKALAARAGVEDFAPHDMRRSFAGDLLDAGADMSTVQQLMGHASPTTTAGYDRRDKRTKIAAVDKLRILDHG